MKSLKKKLTCQCWKHSCNISIQYLNSAPHEKKFLVNFINYKLKLKCNVITDVFMKKK